MYRGASLCKFIASKMRFIYKLTTNFGRSEHGIRLHATFPLYNVSQQTRFITLFVDKLQVTRKKNIEFRFTNFRLIFNVLDTGEARAHFASPTYPSPRAFFVKRNVNGPSLLARTQCPKHTAS